jgi:hypothetical protein
MPKASSLSYFSMTTIVSGSSLRWQMSYCRVPGSLAATSAASCLKKLFASSSLSAFTFTVATTLIMAVSPRRRARA